MQRCASSAGMTESLCACVRAPGQLCLVVLVRLHRFALLLPVHLLPLLWGAMAGRNHSCTPLHAGGSTLCLDAEGHRKEWSKREAPYNCEVLRLCLVLGLLDLGLLLPRDLLLPRELDDLSRKAHSARQNSLGQAVCMCRWQCEESH